MHNFISKGDFHAGKRYWLTKKKKKPFASKRSLCVLCMHVSCCMQTSLILFVWGVFGKQKNLVWSRTPWIISCLQKGREKKLFPWTLGLDLIITHLYLLPAWRSPQLYFYERAQELNSSTNYTAQKSWANGGAAGGSKSRTIRDAKGERGRGTPR